MDHQSNIAWILKTINEGLHDGKSSFELNTTLPETTTIDPDKFNRMTVSIDGELYAISVFRPAEAPVEGIQPEEAPPLILDHKVSEGYRQFHSDHRDNSKLHELYVAWALYDLEIIGRALEEMQEVSRWPMTFIASALKEAMGKEILENAAWFEAAALIHAGADISKYLERTKSMEEQSQAGPLVDD